jgi:hypothetical protein
MPRCGTDDTCTFNCAPGFGDCDNNATNGCEADLSSTATCGACGAACAPSQTCRMGSCTAGTITGYDLASSPPTTPFVDVCAMPGAVMSLNRSDDEAVQVTIPFAFHFWGETFGLLRTMGASSNGLLWGDGSSIGKRTIERTGIPNENLTNLSIAPYWGDNYNYGPQCFLTLGAAPNRRWVSEWSDSGACCAPSPTTPPHAPTLRYEVLLYEGSDAIEFIYDRRENAMPRAIGIEDERGLRGTSPCGPRGLCVPMTNYRFNPRY